MKRLDLDSSMGDPSPGARWRLALRLVVLLVLVALFVRSADVLPSTLATLRNVSVPGYLAALGLFFLSLVAGAFRIQVVIHSTGQRMPFSLLLLDGVKSTGLNAIVTTGVGEVYRVNQLRKRGLGLIPASGAVLLDRCLGLLLIVLATAAGTAAFGIELTGIRLPAFASLLLFVTGLIAVGMVGFWIARRWARDYTALFSEPRRWVALLTSSLLGLFFWIASLGTLALALGIEIEPTILAFAVPLVTLATLVPISIGGIGIREAGYAFVLAPYGVTAGEAVALGLVQYSAFLIVALCAGVLLSIDREGAAQAV